MGLTSANAIDATMAAPTRTFILFPTAIVLLAALLQHLFPQPAVAAEAEPLTTATAIARSVIAETDEPPPVSLEAVVTHSDASGTTFLRDETGSTFIFFNKPARPRIPRGERVRVDGVVHRGLFINGIRPSRVEPLGADPLPAPKPITPQLMASGVLHYDWVSLEGMGRSWQRTGNKTATLMVNVAGDPVDAVGFADAGPFSARLAEARVRVTASGNPVVPRRPSADEIRFNCDAQLIQIEIAVIEREAREGATLLVADLDGISMQVVAPGTLSPEIVPGATNRRDPSLACHAAPRRSRQGSVAHRSLPANPTLPASISSPAGPRRC